MAFLIRFVIIPIAVFLLLRFILRTLSSADRSGKIMAEEAGFACAVFSALGHVLEGKENVPRERLLRQVLGIIAAAESSGGSGKRERIPAVRAIENDGSLCRALMALYAEGALPGRELSLDAGTVRGSRRGVFLHAIASALMVSEKGEGWQRRFADVAGALGISAREAALGSASRSSRRFLTRVRELLPRRRQMTAPLRGTAAPMSSGEGSDRPSPMTRLSLYSA